MYRPPQDTSAGAVQQQQQQHQQLQHGFLSATTPSSSFSQTQFPSPLFALDLSLQDSPQLQQAAATEHHPNPSPKSTPLQRSPSQPGSMGPPPSASPHASRNSGPVTASNRNQRSDRALPSTSVTSETLTQAYVDFILYCNPQFPLDVDTEVLQTNFNNPPKSDNKEPFATYHLFQLVQKLEAKEIKTWNQLALDLGVEPPGEGQSVQKVQQYTVRLKRWMRAMHIDAFFEYLLGKQHPYFTEVPSSSDPYPPQGRDGVLAEDDLAVRALDPAFRPKRGRRRNSEIELAAELEAEKAARQAQDTNSAYPNTAHPDAYSDPWAVASAVTPQTFAPWARNNEGVPHTAVATTAPSHLRWHLHGSSHVVATPHPMTGQPTSMAAHLDAAFDAVSASSATPARKRRKHGPAVSSAWPSANGPGGKPRGRPPVSRNAPEGPFGSFPVASPATSSAVIPMTDSMSTDVTDLGTEGAPTARPVPVHRQSDGPGRPGKLSLQVPQRSGGAVRLATPPPRVLVNGEADGIDDMTGTAASSTNESASSQIQQGNRPRVTSIIRPVEREIPGFAFEALKRVLTSDLLRGHIVGRRHRLTGDEAKRLADAILQRLGVPRADTDHARDDISRLTAASWLGLGEQFNVPFGPATSQGKRITVTRFRKDDDGYEEIVPEHEESDDKVRQVFDLSWTVSMAGCSGTFQLCGITLADKDTTYGQDHLDKLAEKCLAVAATFGQESDFVLKDSFARAVQMKNHSQPSADGIDWKSRCMAMEFAGKLVQGEMERTKNRLIQRVLEVLM